jgi:hypothetical protein
MEYPHVPTKGYRERASSYYTIQTTKKKNKFIYIQGIVKGGDSTTCKLKCKLKGDDPKKTTEEIIQKAKEQGFVFRGGTTKGDFTYEGVITAQGTYSRSGKTLTIEVTKKPFFVSCSRIVNELNKILAEYLSCKEK